MRHHVRKLIFSAGLVILVAHCSGRPPRIPLLITPNTNDTNSSTSGLSAGLRETLIPKATAARTSTTEVSLLGKHKPQRPCPNRKTFLCFPGPNVNHAFKHVHGKTIDLGALEPSDQNCSDALGINNLGEIAGQSSISTIDPLLGTDEVRAVVWKDGTIHDLGTFGGNDASASSINNRGQVAGFALNDIPDPYSLFGFFFNGSSNSTQTRAFIWENGKLKDLGTLGGSDAQAFPGNINEKGQIPGVSYLNDIPTITGLPPVHPFLWDGKKMIDMGSLGGDFGFTVQLTNRGEAIGIGLLKDDVAQHGFLWSNGVMQDLGTLGGTIGEANAINEKGEVVGDAYFPGDTVRHALLWRNGNRKDLGVLPGDICSAAWWINSQDKSSGTPVSAASESAHLFGKTARSRI